MAKKLLAVAYAPVIRIKGKPHVDYSFIRSTRRRMIDDFANAAYGGCRD